MDRLFGKTALITGAARGLGEAIARRFAEEGARVVVTDRDGEGAARVAQEIDGVAQTLDVTDRAGVDRAIEEAASHWNGLDILVNNAGINGLENKSERWVEERLQAMMQRAEQVATLGHITDHDDRTIELTDDEWLHMFDVHVNGTFYCTRAALRVMAPAGSGSVINLGSIMGTAGGSGSSHYCAAKAAILGFTRAVARETASRGIRVNAIAPGWIDTDMTRVLKDARALIAAQTPMLRFGDADDIAWAAVYLASEEARFVTGQVLSPNGGWHMSQ